MQRGGFAERGPQAFEPRPYPDPADQAIYAEHRQWQDPPPIRPWMSPGYYDLLCRSPMLEELQNYNRRQEYTRANADILPPVIRNWLFDITFWVLLRLSTLFTKRYTNYPSNVFEAIYKHRHRGRSIGRHWLRRALRQHHSDVSTRRALFITMAYLATGTSYKFMGLLFWLRPTVMSSLVNKTLRVLVDALPDFQWPQNEREWRCLEEAAFNKYGITHLAGITDLKVVRIPSTDPDDWDPVRKYYCKKYLVVMAITGVVMSLQPFPGSWSDQECYNNSDFRRDITAPNNPLRLPGMLKFRDVPGDGPLMFVSDLSANNLSFCPFIVVTTGRAFINNVRLEVERLFGKVTQIHRFLLELTWTEPTHDIPLMAEVAFKLMNFRARMPINTERNHVHTSTCPHDPVHKCTVWCHHFASRFCDETLATARPTTQDGRDRVIRHWATAGQQELASFMRARLTQYRRFRMRNGRGADN